MRDEAQLRRMIDAEKFVQWELHLYLDSHPYAAEAARKLQESQERCRKLVEEYEEAHGPMCETSAQCSRWAWISDPWPWETEANL